MANFLKTTGKKTLLSLRRNPQRRNGWYFKQSENPRSGRIQVVIMICCALVILSFFNYKFNIIRLTSDMLDSLLDPRARAAIITDSSITENLPTVSENPLESNLVSADAVTPLEETVTPTNVINPVADAIVVFTDSLSETVTPTNTIIPLAETSTPTDVTTPLAEMTTPTNIANPAPEQQPESQNQPQPQIQPENLAQQSQTVVTKVTSPILFGTFKTGIVPIMVLFNNPITVSGKPQLIISTGNPATTVADYKFSFRNFIVFLYQISPGNYSSDLDYNSSSSLVLNGAEIKDKSGNNASLVLPQPDSSGSLSGYSDIVIDAVR